MRKPASTAGLAASGFWRVMARLIRPIVGSTMPDQVAYYLAKIEDNKDNWTADYFRSMLARELERVGK